MKCVTPTGSNVIFGQICARGQTDTWSPGLSGGDHHPEWSEEAVALASKLLSAKPPCSYSGLASELHRRLNFQTHRASVRHWARLIHLPPLDSSTNCVLQTTKPQLAVVSQYAMPQMRLSGR